MSARRPGCLRWRAMASLCGRQCFEAAVCVFRSNVHPHSLHQLRLLRCFCHRAGRMHEPFWPVSASPWSVAGGSDFRSAPYCMYKSVCAGRSGVSIVWRRCSARKNCMAVEVQHHVRGNAFTEGAWKFLSARHPCRSNNNTVAILCQTVCT